MAFWTHSLSARTARGWTHEPARRYTPAAMSTRALLRHWRLPLSLAVLLILLQAAGWRQPLEYERSAVLQGQLWRLLTGNLVHLGWIHLGRDLAGLLLIWALFGHSLKERSWLGVLLSSALAVGLGLLLLDPGIGWYVGISGVLFGMFCAGSLRQFPRHPLAGSAMLLGMLLIIAWTLHAGALPDETVDLGGAVVPQAHLYGAIGGAAFILARGVYRGRNAARSQPQRHHPGSGVPPG